MLIYPGDQGLVGGWGREEVCGGRGGEGVNHVITCLLFGDLSFCFASG